MCGLLALIMNTCPRSSLGGSLVDLLRNGLHRNLSNNNTGSGTGSGTGNGTENTTSSTITWPCGCGQLQLISNTCPNMCEPRNCQTNINVPNGASVELVMSNGRITDYYYNGQRIECVDQYNVNGNGGYPSL